MAKGSVRKKGKKWYYRFYIISCTDRSDHLRHFYDPVSPQMFMNYPSHAVQWLLWKWYSAYEDRDRPQLKRDADLHLYFDESLLLFFISNFLLPHTHTQYH